MKRLAVKLTKSGEQSVIKGHPWIFSNSINKISAGAKIGDLSIIFSRSNNSLIGIGIYDAGSPIRIKIIYHGTKSILVNYDFFERRIVEAYDKRLPLFKTNTNAYRLLFGENDGFPGIITDVYDEVLVIKLYSNIWVSFIQELAEILIKIIAPEAVVIRLSRKLQVDNAYGFIDGQILHGQLNSEIVNFVEHGVHFSANVIKGHKTGYFLDHRHNRVKVGGLSLGKSVLDVFAYAGGFSVHALAGGAHTVTSIDISGQALETAKDNAALNRFEGEHITLKGDAFELLKTLCNQRKSYDIVVVDPPSFAKEQSQIRVAVKKYKQLARLGMQLTSDGGLLVLASCSSRVTAETFFEINERALASSKRPFSMVDKTMHDIDHPIAFTEGAYLKCGFYRFDS